MSFKRKERIIPTVHITPNLKRGTVEFSSRIIWNKKCAACQKHAWVGYWKVVLHRAQLEDGQQQVERLYFCSQACGTEEIILVNETRSRLMIHW